MTTIGTAAIKLLHYYDYAYYYDFFFFLAYIEGNCPGSGPDQSIVLSSSISFVNGAHNSLPNQVAKPSEDFSAAG